MTNQNDITKTSSYFIYSKLNLDQTAQCTYLDAAALTNLKASILTN